MSARVTRVLVDIDAVLVKPEPPRAFEDDVTRYISPWNQFIDRLHNERVIHALGVGYAVLMGLALVGFILTINV